MHSSFRLGEFSTMALMASGVAWGVPAPASAEITGVTVADSKEIGPFQGKLYVEINARMEGTAPGGAYSVPITLALPKNAADHNGFVVVDAVNTITIYFDNWVLGGQPLPLARGHMGDEFLFGRGHAYVSVIWDKTAIEALKNGTISVAADGYTILRDTAALARNPGGHLPADAGLAEMVGSDRLIAYGYSQTGALLRGWYFDHLNSAEGDPTFDGALIGGTSGGCLDLASGGFKGCAGPVSDGGKVIAFMAETDAEWGGFDERGESPDFRLIEIAGVSHIPATAADFRKHGMPEQNPIGFEPVVRAALVNLEAWIDGQEPPPSVHLTLSDAAPTEFEGVPLRAAERDGDGNALGGLRLPHMPTLLDGGEKIGAPLGHYTGLAVDHLGKNSYFLISGTFEPFSPEKLATIYPDHDAYVDAVAASASRLVAERYILPEDAEAYIAAAKAADIGLR